MRSSEEFAIEMVAVFRQTTEGHLLDCNEECARLLGYSSREELMGVGLEYQNASDLASVSSAIRELGVLSNVEIALRRKDEASRGCFRTCGWWKWNQHPRYGSRAPCST